MKKLSFILFLCLTMSAGSLLGQALDSFSIIRTSQPYRLYARIALPNDGYVFSRYIERNTQSVMNTQIFNFLFKDCPATGTTPVYYDTTIDILVTQYTKLFEVQVNVLLDENHMPPCTIRHTMQRTDSLYMTGNEVMSVSDVAPPAFSIYPNPVQQDLYIDAPVRISRYSITDMAGRILQAGHYTGAAISTHLPDGLYLLHIHTGKGLLHKRFVISNQAD